MRRKHRDPKMIAMQSYQFSLRNLVRFVLNRVNRESLTVNISPKCSPNCGAPFLFANIIGRKETPLELRAFRDPTSVFLFTHSEILSVNVTRDVRDSAVA
jgi:hypothetical protein